MHCYTRFTQIKNRCIMGGKGRGVFSDFRLGRVCAGLYCFKESSDTIAVPIPYKRAGWQLAGCEEGELVKRRQIGVFAISSVYYCKATRLLGRRLCFQYDPIQQSAAAQGVRSVLHCSFSARARALSPLTAGTRAATHRANEHDASTDIKSVYLASTADTPPPLLQAQRRL